MKITDQAKNMLEQILQENGVDTIRLYAAAGCCGPQFALSLEAPLETDQVETINGIKVAFDQGVTGTEQLTLDLEESADGAGLVLLGASECC